jgi:hypothetical protein
VQLKTLLKQAENFADPDKALTTYFSYFLDQKEVSGLFLQAQWRDLQPSDAGPNPLEPTKNSFAFHYLKDAFDAVHQAGKTLQLVVSPDFNSPLTLNTLMQPGSDWLLNYLTSCDGLFGAAEPISSSCGYTKIFYQTEDKTDVGQIPLPMPWKRILPRLRAVR